MSTGNSDEESDQPQQQSSPRAKRYQVLLDPTLARKVGMVAAALDMSIPAYVNSRLGPIVEKELVEELQRLEIRVPPG